MEDMFAYFTVGGLAPLHNKKTEHILTVIIRFYLRGLDCSMVKKSDFTNSILPLAYKMPVAVNDPLNYHFDTARGKTTLQALLSSLTAAGLDITTLQTEATLTSDGPDGVGAVAMGTRNTILPTPVR
jgi:hypothetical protein